MDRNLLQELEFSKNRYKGIHPKRVKLIVWQLLRGLSYLHNRGIVHRDVKPENILLNGNCNVKLCDFGFARHRENPKAQDLTYYVATRWYRAPELLVGQKNYDFGVDIWSVGCMFLELLTGKPLFAGDNDMQQLCLIVQCRGPLTDEQKQHIHLNKVGLPQQADRHKLEVRYPGLHVEELEFLNLCLAMDPVERASANQLLSLPYFKGLETRKVTRTESQNPLLLTPSGSENKRRKVFHVANTPDSVQSSATKVTQLTPPMTAQSTDSFSTPTVGKTFNRLSQEQQLSTPTAARNIIQKLLSCRNPTATSQTTPPPSDSKLTSNFDTTYYLRKPSFVDIHARGYNNHLKQTNIQVKVLQSRVFTEEQNMPSKPKASAQQQSNQNFKSPSLSQFKVKVIKVPQKKEMNAPQKTVKETV